jgi:hypothetical protein
MNDLEDDPFAVLGLDACRVDEETVRAAFRRAALSAHPDKQQQGPGGSRRTHDIGGLVDARDRALALVASRSRDEADGRVALLIWLAHAVLSRDRAIPIDIAVDATLADLYEARVKRIVISVLRVPHLFKRTQQVLHVRTAAPSRDAAADSAPVVLRRMGDDAPADVLLGRRTAPRGDVRVHLRLIVDPRDDVVPDTVICPCDLHARAGVSIRGRYLGERVRVRLPNGGGMHSVHSSVVADYDGTAAGAAGAAAEADDISNSRQVRVFPGKGLPYLSGKPGTPIAGRGDLYVFLEVRLPRAPRLDDPEVIRALDVLSRE